VKKPSPSAAAAIVIATLSFAVTAAGVGYAAGKIDGSQIKKHSIAGNRLKNNTLTGKQINESKLRTVPKAAHADSATNATHATTAGTATHATSAATATSAGSAVTVDGNGLGSFSFTVANGGAGQSVTFPGVTLSANCASGLVNLDAAGTSDTGESIVISSIDGGTVNSGSDSSFTTGDADAISPDSATDGTATAVVTRGAGLATTITASWQSNSDQSCTYSGTAVATAG
jgi:hypothetical protein